MCFLKLFHQFILIGLLLFSVSPADAQQYLTQAGSPTFTSADPVEFGFVNLGNGNLHLTIPIASFPQRGNYPFAAALVYDSRIWQVVSGSSNAWQPTNVQTPQGTSSQGGWRFVTSADPGNVNFLEASQTCVINNFRVPSGNIFDTFTWTASDGTQHFFAISTRQKLACGADVPNADGFATDSSGFHMYVTNYNHASVFAPDGTEGALCGLPAAAGYTLPGNPYSNLTNNNNTPFGTVSTQVHELGHSLFKITSGSNLIPEPNGEVGKALEDCVKKNHGIQRN